MSEQRMRLTGLHHLTAICRDLDLAEATVKNHVTAVLKALNVTNRTEAVIVVGALGWKLPAPKMRRPA